MLNVIVNICKLKIVQEFGIFYFTISFFCQSLLLVSLYVDFSEIIVMEEKKPK